jgi:hypothetical protein
VEKVGFLSSPTRDPEFRIPARGHAPLPALAKIFLKHSDPETLN